MVSGRGLQKLTHRYPQGCGLLRRIPILSGKRMHLIAFKSVETRKQHARSRASELPTRCVTQRVEYLLQHFVITLALNGQGQHAACFRTNN